MYNTNIVYFDFSPGMKQPRCYIQRCVCVFISNLYYTRTLGAYGPLVLAPTEGMGAPCQVWVIFLTFFYYIYIYIFFLILFFLLYFYFFYFFTLIFNFFYFIFIFIIIFFYFFFFTFLTFLKTFFLLL